MSRVYRIKVSESSTQTVHVEDGVECPLDILGVLSPEEMNELLRQELEKKGFSRSEEGTMIKELDGGVIIEIDPDERKVRASVKEDKSITASVDLEKKTYEEVAKQAQINLKKEAVDEVDKQIKEKEAKLSAEATKRLENVLGDLHGEINQVTTKVCVEALKKRASQLGEIEECIEGEDGSLRIRVKV